MPAQICAELIWFENVGLGAGLELCTSIFVLGSSGTIDSSQEVTFFFAGSQEVTFVCLRCLGLLGVLALIVSRVCDVDNVLCSTVSMVIHGCLQSSTLVPWHWSIG